MISSVIASKAAPAAKASAGRKAILSAPA
jgi:hypothetical protein